jgi:transcription elongation factor GreA
MKQDIIQLTQEGYENLKRELDELVLKKRPYLVERLVHASSMGDLSENSDYTSAKEELEFVDGRIAELKEILSKAQIVVPNSDNYVAVGSKVRVEVNGAEHTFHIVGEWEADPKEKKISCESPLGRALLGKKPGDKVEVEAPAGRITYTVLAIE